MKDNKRNKEKVNKNVVEENSGNKKKGNKNSATEDTGTRQRVTGNSFNKNTKDHDQDKEEMLPVINEEGELIGTVPRRIAHDGKSMLLHPVIHLHIINSAGQIFLQKRPADKDVQPGKWDTSVGGHVDPGETIIEALLRETQEEAGLVDFEYEFISKYLWQSEREREMVHSFVTRDNREPRIDTAEIAGGRFWSREEIEDGFEKQLFTPNFEYEYMHVLKARG